MSEEPNGKKQVELHSEGEAALPIVNELADSQLDAVVGGVVGGALTAGKPAVPWSVFKE